MSTALLGKHPRKIKKQSKTKQNKPSGSSLLAFFFPVCPPASDFAGGAWLRSACQLPAPPLPCPTASPGWGGCSLPSLWSSSLGDGGWEGFIPLGSFGFQTGPAECLLNGRGPPLVIYSWQRPMLWAEVHNRDRGLGRGVFQGNGVLEKGWNH